MGRTLGIVARSLSEGSRALFAALGEALDLRFERRSLGEGQDLAGWILLDVDRNVVESVRTCDVPCFAVLSPTECVDSGPDGRLVFGAAVAVPDVFRSRVVVADDVPCARSLPSWLEGVRPLASKAGASVWAESVDGAHHFSSVQLPPLEDDTPLFAHLSGKRLAGLLPLVSFLRWTTEEPGWDSPPLQAAFMFDDPNLHWPSYGFVDYREMAARAAARRFHVAFATIPLDAWLVNRRASAIFREHGAHLSLLLHGNDHISNELARPRTSVAASEILAQAVERGVRLESLSGVPVPRIMAPPHGACNLSTIAAMAQLAFESLCISRGSLHHHNAGASWARRFGFRPCERIADLPVIPRFGLTADCTNDILIAAWLRQPIIPMTHHEAVEDGYHLLDSAADLINSLGDVSWGGLSAITRRLYQTKRTGDVVEVRMLSRRVALSASDEPTRVMVRQTAPERCTQPALWWRSAGTMPSAWRPYQHDHGVSVRAGERVDIAEDCMAAPRNVQHQGSLLNVAGFGRRVLTEGRDRARPIVRRLRTPRFSGPTEGQS